jgi:hypothetical protein
MSCKVQPSSSTLHFEDFNDNEKIDNRMKLVMMNQMDTKSYSSDNNKEGSLGKNSFNFMNEERNEE